jgi:low affinity Fe/Cu permease
MPNGKQRRETRRVERFRRGKIRSKPARRAFTRFASWASDHLASPSAFAMAFGVIVVWAIAGPFFGWSPEHMLVINTVTTIGTWLMVFVIQNTQARESKAVHLKLDELLRAIPEARDEFMEVEEEDLEEILREKEIVDRADPAPPEDKEEGRRDGDGQRREERRAS